MVDKIYIGRDGRVRTLKHNSKSVVSYPRVLMENKLGRPLRADEQVHHIDGNPLNNELENLEVKILGEHQREHNAPKYCDKIIICAWCGKEFIWTAKQQRLSHSNNSRKTRANKNMVGPFCSKSCVGRYGKAIQVNKCESVAK